MKKLLVTFLLITLSLPSLAALTDDNTVAGAEVSLEDSLEQEQSTTQWEEENKFVAGSSRSTSSSNDQESALESDQVEYEVIEQ
ncbi:MAG: hypothetical protein AABY86_17620 [Bdellovibrionota bacterium]